MNEATLTRRKVLKRAGVAGAAVWTVPFLASSASADVGIEALRKKCHNADNSPRCPQCGGNNLCTTKNGTQCFCFAGIKQNAGSGCCECQGNYFCNGARLCDDNNDCPPGFKCVTSCCDGIVHGLRALRSAVRASPALTSAQGRRRPARPASAQPVLGRGLFGGPSACVPSDQG